MTSWSRQVVGCAVCVVAVGTVQCARSDSATTSPADTLMECRAADIRHVLRIRPASHEVDDLTFTPAKTGTADVSGTDYRLQFHESRDNYDLVLRFDATTGKGTRRLFDDEQQAIQGHGGTDDIVCTRATEH
ncbi:MAG: hypothetical protein U0Q11_07840 [Vicinamibacterales bacterium]